MKKLRVGWYSFSCCEDSTIIFTELLNDYWKIWKDKIEIVYAPVLQKRGKAEQTQRSHEQGIYKGTVTDEREKMMDAVDQVS